MGMHLNQSIYFITAPDHMSPAHGNKCMRRVIVENVRRHFE